MKVAFVIWCLFAISDALSLIVPVNKEYLTEIDDGNEELVQIIDLVSNEEQLLSKREGRQYYSNARLPTQNYGGYVGNGYGGYYSRYPNYPNRRSYKGQRRRRFGGIGSAIIV